MTPRGLIQREFLHLQMSLAWPVSIFRTTPGPSPLSTGTVMGIWMCGFAIELRLGCD